jgi:hypothetical protein
MPCILIWEERGSLVRYSGIVTDHDVRQSTLDQYNDHRFETLKYQIVDFTNVTKLDLSSELVRWVAKFDAQASERNPLIRTAVVGDEPLLKGLANMYRSNFDLSDGSWEQEHFSTMDEARAWAADI